MDEVIAALVGLGLGTLVSFFLTSVLVNSDWRYDCEQMGMHRHGDEVYKCEKVKK